MRKTLRLDAENVEVLENLDGKILPFFWEILVVFLHKNPLFYKEKIMVGKKYFLINFRRIKFLENSFSVYRFNLYSKFLCKKENFL